MIPRERPSCYVIGSESLLVQCSEILLREGFEIHGVVSAEPAIREWAESKGLARFELGAGLPGELRARPFDYLFSIANLAILPQDLLELPRKGAINFHDGPLPRYAGLHATSWAILRRERTHGVTWHFIESGVDKGRMLKQEMFDISADDTALTLNVKCYEAGIRTFGVLALELSQGTSQPREQALAERTYFGASQRPEGACVLRWEKPAQEIAALVRALDFGPYPNPLGLPKTILGGSSPSARGILPRARRARRRTVTASTTAPSPSRPPARFEIRKLFTLEGASPRGLGIAQRAAHSLDESASAQGDLLHEDICHESFWARLGARRPRNSLAEADRADGAAHALQFARAARGAGLDLREGPRLDAGRCRVRGHLRAARPRDRVAPARRRLLRAGHPRGDEGPRAALRVRRPAAGGSSSRRAVRGLRAVHRERARASEKPEDVSA
jgi:methionyl-tRNA formyltransferase